MESKPTKAATFDPGWNDPPPLSFASQISTPPKPRTTLNKRLAFPVQSSTAPPTNAQATSGLPPVVQPANSLPHVLPPTLLPTSIAPDNNLTISSVTADNYHSPTIDLLSGSKVNESNSNVAENHEIFDSNKMCSVVIDYFNDILANSSELGSKIKDIKKRIDTLHTQWEKGQLSEEVQIKIFDLVEALKHRNIPEANVIHQCLVVDHISSVSTWIPGIRQLIHHLQAKEELLSIDSLEDRNNS